MTDTKLEQKYRPLVGDPFTLESITRVNHRPHPFTVGSRHVVHASDHHGGMLGEATLRAVPCAHRGCRASFEDHTSDHVMFLKLTRHATNAEAQTALKALAAAGVEADGIDGFGFVETPEKFRVQDPQEGNS
jgi:hypothetical protein